MISPVVVIPENEDWVAAERSWIEAFRAKGCNLVNHASGGQGPTGYKFSMEARAKMSAQRRNPSQAYRDKMSAALKGRKHSPAAIAKMSESKKGKRPSEETRARMSAAQRLRVPMPAETRAKIAEAMRKRPPLTPEQRAKIGAKHRGKVMSEDARAKMRLAWERRRLVPVTEETRAKLSEASRRRAAAKKQAGADTHV